LLKDLRNIVVKRTAKENIADAKEKRCSECPFHAQTQIRSISARTFREQLNSEGAAEGWNHTFWLKYLSSLVKVTNKPFTCHMEPTKHCYGASKVQPLVVLNK
jgi:hypothetical protein